MVPNASPSRASVYGRESAAHQKSIDDQVAIAADVIAENGWVQVGAFDDGSSASRFATKRRPGWERLRDDLRAGGVDVLVVWEATRGSREPIDWLTLLGECRERGVQIFVIADERLYDPRRAGDFKHLATAGIDGAYESDKISERVTRGHLSAAKVGRPPVGKVPYGYRRRRWQERDPQTGRLKSIVLQEVDPETAPTVVSIFEQVAQHVPISRIVEKLNADGTPGARWSGSRVRSLVRNVAYVGLRVHRRHGRYRDAQPQNHPGDWDPIVSAELFYAVQRLLDVPGRTTTIVRPGKQRHLLSILSTCHRGHEIRGHKGETYTCRVGCVLVPRAAADTYVELHILEALATPNIYRKLRQASEVSDAEAQKARDEAAALRDQLAQWRKAARAGKVTPESFGEIEAGILADIAEAEARAEQAGVPPALRPFLEPGVDVEDRWKDATLPARREVIKAVAIVTMHPAGRGQQPPIEQRVKIEARLGVSKVRDLHVAR